LLEKPENLEEVQHRATEAVVLIDHDTIDSVGLNVDQEPAKGRALGIPTREAAVVVPVWEHRPTLVALTSYVVLCSFALVV
jgi:hypothetical protein